MKLFSVIEKGVRSSGSMGRSTLVLMVLSAVVLLIIWASIAEVDRVARGDGHVIPSQQVQIIQSYEGGIVKRILVKEGDIVKKGDVLMEIDHSVLVSQLKENKQKYLSLMARAQRLGAEVGGKPLKFGPELLSGADSVVKTETLLYTARRDALENELRLVGQQIDQKRQEVAEAQINLSTANRSLESIKQEINIIEPLVKRGIEPEINLLQLRRTANEQQGKRDSAATSIVRLQSALAELESRRIGATDKYRSEALTDLTAITAQIAELEQKLPSLEDQVNRTELQSPVHGVVNRIHITTVGGVAQSGTPLMEVVPIDDTLLIEAEVKPENIAFLRSGQPVLVKITAYDFSRYGGLTGTLVNIGADAVKTGEHKESPNVYRIKVRTQENALHADGKKFEIIPGMVAQVDVITGKRTVLHYLIDPVLKVRDNAFRD
jgi:membrane fusion protein, adhesin transport system